MSKNKKTLIAVIILLVLTAAVLVCAVLFTPKAEEGPKTLSLTVIDNAGKKTTYAVEADAAYLRQAMESAEGLEFSGQEGQYGMMVETVNGLRAVYGEDNAYWAFYQDKDGDLEPDGDEYCMYGIDTQPVAAGDSFLIVYEKAQ